MLFLQGASMTNKPFELSDPVENLDDGHLLAPTPRPGYHPVHSLPGFLKEKLVQLDLAAAQMNAKGNDT
jgi:hypothetical protein